MTTHNLPQVRHYATWLYPGLLFPEEITKEIVTPTPESALENVPRTGMRPFAFTIYSVLNGTTSIGNEMVEVRGSPQKEPGRFYVGGELFTAQEIEALSREEKCDYSILLSNMRSNHWDRMIRALTGNWQPFEPEDHLLPPLVVEDQHPVR